MRWTYWASVLLAAIGLVRPAAGAGPGYSTCPSCQHHGTYGARACGAPLFGTTPGCCRNQPSPSDNAWAGYCDERAPWRALWYRVGTRGPYYQEPMPVAYGPYNGMGAAPTAIGGQPPTATRQRELPVPPAPPEPGILVEPSVPFEPTPRVEPGMPIEPGIPAGPGVPIEQSIPIETDVPAEPLEPTVVPLSEPVVKNMTTKTSKLPWLE